jgi:hypothetical protein
MSAEAANVEYDGFGGERKAGSMIGGGEGFDPRRGEESRASRRSPPLIRRSRRCHASATGSASLCRRWTPAGRGVERRAGTALIGVLVGSILAG